jgi:hypothetical protein
MTVEKGGTTMGNGVLVKAQTQRERFLFGGPADRLAERPPIADDWLEVGNDAIEVALPRDRTEFLTAIRQEGGE